MPRLSTVYKLKSQAHTPNTLHITLILSDNTHQSPSQTSVKHVWMIRALTTDEHLKHFPHGNVLLQIVLKDTWQLRYDGFEFPCYLWKESVHPGRQIEVSKQYVNARGVEKLPLQMTRRKSHRLMR